MQDVAETNPAVFLYHKQGLFFDLSEEFVHSEWDPWKHNPMNIRMKCRLFPSLSCHVWGESNWGGGRRNQREYEEAQMEMIIA